MLLNVSSYLVSDYDLLWKVTHEIIEELPFRLKLTWIKGHNDILLDGPFYRPVQLNILVDMLAGQGHLAGMKGRRVVRKVYSTSVMPL